MNRIIGSFTLCTLLMLTACSESVPTNTSAEKPPRPVRIVTVQDASGEQLRQFPAVVEAAEVAQLTFRVAGEITELPVRSGAEVKKGNLIARLDPTDYRLAMEQAKAQFDLASSQYQRNKKLVEQGLMSEAQFDQIESELAVARANYETTKANLGYTELRAPFDGVIAQRPVERYENIQAKQPIATLQIANAVDVSIQVPENLFAQVNKNLNYEPTVVFDASPQKRFVGHIKEWDSQADPATNTYEVVFTLPRPDDLNILPGMTATVIVDLRQVMRSTLDGVLVPSTAVFDEQDNLHYVWVVNQQMQVEKRRVSVGNMTNDGLLVTEGLAAGERIVSAGVFQLQPQQKVREWHRERGL
ncbi:RND family efflux transporter MFP subunit [Idiomarina fontislapidosi]|uniref:Efflux RND transporter periplasmic adaptor subunit n=1 Tax=Idiomarina fontislapidosi TaxID=263723 RepID=A0A432Y2B4_9GAMM|nr:efflux RND transporter periplasmic adaptor subunit [Idiomarina fontislapidosi]PYE33247.1 RND family efflux transporter MFP subunit [Idiomarina fontislapidosi]RUO55087.1 efflux RND transporter periplasmic adaptor subunit [Idiomarina fontislapidosi]